MKEQKGFCGNIIYVPDDTFEGTSNHPICGFFELFQSSRNPETNVFDSPVCHMLLTIDAHICMGDYLNCPLVWKVKENDTEL